MIDHLNIACGCGVGGGPHQWGGVENTPPPSMGHGAFQISSGLTTSIGTQIKSFYAAFKDGVPYSPSKHWEGAKWHYAWHGHYTVCHTADLKCYFLPITKCQSRIG